MKNEPLFNVKSNILFLIDINKRILNECITLENSEYKSIKDLSNSLLRKMIKLCFGNTMDGISIEKSSYGKPYLKNTENIWFNLSHSGSTLALLLSRTGEVGVDIEFRTHQRNYTKIANRFFHTKEKLSLRQLSSYAAECRSHMLWCLKESYIKAIGKGLAQPLNSFRFEIEQDHIDLYEPNELNISQRWSCHYLKLNHNLGLSVCIPTGTSIEYFCLNNNISIK